MLARMRKQAEEEARSQTESAEGTEAPKEEAAEKQEPSEAQKEEPQKEESTEKQEEAAQEAHTWDRVYRQFQQAQKRFPQMNLVEEMKNPVFGRLIAAGFPVETAYEMVHLRELIGRAMAQVARQTAMEMTQALQSGSLRPREGALGGPQGAVYVRDPRYFTQQQREDYRNRAMRGERVIF